MSDASKERRKVRYEGHVQGVGFRHSATQVSRRHLVTGYVKNLSNGSVELVAEGAPAELDAFLADIAQTMSGYIHRSQVEKSPALGEFSDFLIQH